MKRPRPLKIKTPLGWSGIKVILSRLEGGASKTKKKPGRTNAAGLSLSEFDYWSSSARFAQPSSDAAALLIEFVALAVQYPVRELHHAAALMPSAVFTALRKSETALLRRGSTSLAFLSTVASNAAAAVAK